MELANMNYERCMKAITIFMLLVVGTYFIIHYYHFYHDDEMISLRYVKNFLSGKGLVWNNGERVEGYTNFLHLVFSAGIIRITGDYLIAPRILNFLFLFLMLFTTYYIIHKAALTVLFKSASLQVFFLIVFLHPSIIIWSYGGLETIMYSGLLFIAILFFLSEGRSWRREVFTGVLFVMASMTRPEGNLIFFISSVFLLLEGWKNKNWQKSINIIIPYAILYGMYFLWRYNYYGQFLPNTFYAKTSFTSSKLLGGITYVLRFGLSIIVPLFLILLCIIRYWKKNIIKDLRVVYLAAIIIIYTAVIVSYGGDHMLGMRFCIPLIPVLALFLVLLMNYANYRYTVIARILLSVNALYLCILPMNSFTMTTKTDDAAAVGMVVGRYISANMPSDAVIATNSAGAIPFYAPQNQFIDMLGLCDTAIAHHRIDKEMAARFSWAGHEKGYGRYVLDREPDIIILGPAQGNEATNPALLSDLEIVSDQSFLKNYEMKKVIIETKGLHTGSIVTFRNPKTKTSVAFTYYQRKLQ